LERRRIRKAASDNFRRGRDVLVSQLAASGELQLKNLELRGWDVGAAWKPALLTQATRTGRRAKANSPFMTALFSLIRSYWKTRTSKRAWTATSNFSQNLKLLRGRRT